MIVKQREGTVDSKSSEFGRHHQHQSSSKKKEKKISHHHWEAVECGREGQEPCSELQIFKSWLSHLLWFLGQVSANEDNNETYLSIITIIFHNKLG